MPSLAGRDYIPKLYRIQSSRREVVDVLTGGIEASGARVVSCSFPDALLAPIVIGAEDSEGHRYGLLAYPFTTTKRTIRNRPASEHRFQILLKGGRPAMRDAVRAALVARYGETRWPGVAVDVDPLTVM